MRQVHDSAFNLPEIRLRDRLTRRTRHFAMSRYPHMLTRVECWTVRAEIQGELVGYAWSYDIADEHRSAYIDDVAIFAHHQGRGIGTAIIKEMVAWLHETGIRDITGMPTNDCMARIFSRHAITPGPR